MGNFTTNKFPNFGEFAIEGTKYQNQTWPKHRQYYFYIQPDFSTWFILSCLATKILLDRDDLDKEVLRSGVGVVGSKLDDSLLFDADEVLQDIFSEDILLDKDDILGDDIVKSRSSTAELINRDDLDSVSYTHLTLPTKRIV